MNFKQIKVGIRDRALKIINERRGWTTKRKIIVIESDDWGSIRMPDRKTYERVLKAGIRVDKSYYNKYDTLASNTDFEHLFELLTKHKDKNGNHPIITANTIMANPDFDKIRESNFEQYFFEPFTDTLKRYGDRSFDCWEEGMKNKLLYPQLHGREHINIGKWMRYLQMQSEEAHFAFDNHLYGIGRKISKENNPSFVRAFDSDTYFRNHTPEVILFDAARLFKEIFGFNSKSFIAPNYYWNNRIEQITASLGVAYLQGVLVQNIPDNGTKYNYLGGRSLYGQVYLTRNVIFEPSSDKNEDWISRALKEIDRAFRLHKPAVISMHRVNFIGSIFEKNREESLALLNVLLNEVKKRWKDIEFMHTVDLGDLIKNDLST